MITLISLAEFSRNHCVAVCSFLVPANLAATSLTLALSFLQVPMRQLLGVFAISSVLALALFIHVGTWFMIGVVMPPTFILLGLGLTCLVADYIAITDIREFVGLWQVVRVLTR